MTPADIALAARIRAALANGRRRRRLSVSGLDGVGKSTLCAALAEALGLPVVQVPDREMVARFRATGCDADEAHIRAVDHQQADTPRACVMDRGPLCVAAIHPRMQHRAWWLARDITVTLFLDLPLDLARARKNDPEAEQRDRDREARRYGELAARWPRTVVIDAAQPPEAVLSAALLAVARAVGVAP